MQALESLSDSQVSNHHHFIISWNTDDKLEAVVLSYVYLHLQMPRHVFCWRYQSERACSRQLAAWRKRLTRLQRPWSLPFTSNRNVKTNFCFPSPTGTWSSWHFPSYLRRSRCTGAASRANESTGASSNCLRSIFGKGHHLLPPQMFIEVGAYHHGLNFSLSQPTLRHQRRFVSNFLKLTMRDRETSTRNGHFIE